MCSKYYHDDKMKVNFKNVQSNCLATNYLLLRDNTRELELTFKVQCIWDMMSHGHFKH